MLVQKARVGRRAYQLDVVLGSADAVLSRLEDESGNAEPTAVAAVTATHAPRHLSSDDYLGSVDELPQPSGRVLTGDV